MRHTKKNLKKISKTSMKKGISTLIMIFFGMVILFQKDAPNTEFQFVRNSNDISMHNAANQQRDYLFEDEGEQTTGTIPTGTITTGSSLEIRIYQNKMRQMIRDGITSNTYSGTIYIGNIASGKNSSGVLYTGSISSGAINTGSISSGAINTGTISSGVINTGTISSGAINTGTISSGVINTGTISSGVINTGTISSGAINTGMTTGVINCLTPRNERVKNKDFVLAYEQRKDVNNICNIEKRTCINGILEGSFTQSSCKENITYEYKKTEVISYNQKVLNEYIQPAAPVHSGAIFSNQGKINTTERATDKRGTSKNQIITKPEAKQTPLPDKTNCSTPRGQKINHGQFVKAYKTPRGFIDFACEVEIRACVNGNLKGAFVYNKCTFNNTTYSEYLKAGSPSSNTGFLFFQRIKAIFR